MVKNDSGRSILKKRKLLFLPVFLILLVLAGLFFFHGFDGLIFSRACSRFFRQSLSGDALSLHFTLADPQKVGIRIESPSLPVYSRQSTGFPTTGAIRWTCFYTALSRKSGERNFLIMRNPFPLLPASIPNCPCF